MPVSVQPVPGSGARRHFPLSVPQRQEAGAGVFPGRAAPCGPALGGRRSGGPRGAPGSQDRALLSRAGPGVVVEAPRVEERIAWDRKWLQRTSSFPRVIFDSARSWRRRARGVVF